jgi:hypothetical protein
MLLSRAVASVVSILLGLSVAAAQQPAFSPAAQPPVFQGLIVDAKGKTVGRYYPVGSGGGPSVVRQISGVWVALTVDLTGFQIWTPKGLNFIYFYQSVDCTGQAYFPVANIDSPPQMPAWGIVAAVPPATASSIYFAGTPANVLTVKSNQAIGPGYQDVGVCKPYSSAIYAGPVQSVPVSSLGLTPPFSVK